MFDLCLNIFLLLCMLIESKNGTPCYKDINFFHELLLHINMKY